MEKEEKKAKVSTSHSDIFETIKEIEQKFPVDSIKLSDGTKLWNLIRILFYTLPQKQSANAKMEKISIKTLFYLLREGVSPFNLAHKKIDICGFSGTENRKLRNEKFYDIYMDPLYEILGDDFYVFEWPTPSGDRRKYGGEIYSKNYVPMYIPIFSRTFWNIGFYKLIRRKKFSVESEDILKNIIAVFCKNTLVNKDELAKSIYDSIAVFSYMKGFFVKLLREISPEVVFIKCGYGRFHMALSQVCREFNIPSIELQHGIIANYHVGYVKATESENRDCVPEYLLTYGDAFSDVVKKGSLFNPNKAISVGFPYLEEVKTSLPFADNKLKDFISNLSVTILITSQWTVADEIKNFVIKMSKELGKLEKNIGIIFKPHPRDWRDYSDMGKYQNIFLASKYDDTYELMKIADIHSTVYSTSGIEALAFGKPNIFIEVKKTNMKEIIYIVDNRTSFIVNSPQQYIKKLEYILLNYERLSKEALKTSEIFFKPNALQNIKEFLETIV